MSSTRRRLTASTALLAFSVLLAGCGGGSTADGSAGTSPTASPAGSSSTTGTTTSAPASESPSASAEGRGRVVTTGASDFGTMLFDPTGQAIYLFDKEGGDRPECYGECAEAWPPVLTTGSPRAKGDVRAGLLGTTERRDGTTQVTYAGHPLYLYAHEGPGQVLCHDVREYGGVWLVVTPGGRAAA